MGLFDKLFGRSKKITQTQLYDFFAPSFQGIGEDIVQSHAVREAVSSITRHASKMRLEHCRLKDAEFKPGRDALNRILQYQPNPIESGADFLEKAMYHWLVSNNVFIFLDFVPSNIFEDKELLDALWVLDPLDVAVNVKSSGAVFLTFSLQDETRTVTTSLDNIVHLKRDVGPDEFFGANNEPIKTVLKVINTNYQGIENAIKTSAFIRFIVESSTVLSPTKKMESAKHFAEQFGSANTKGGLIFTDAANKITQISPAGRYANFKEMEGFVDTVYHYFGTNRKIVANDFSDAEWNAFFEGTLEVFANKLGLSLSKKAFTEGEFNRGNRIRVHTDKIQSMSLQSRLNIIVQTKDVGLLTINEMRALLYLPPVVGGDIREVSLNYVEALKQGQYQLGDKDKEEGGTGDGAKEDESENGTS